LAKRSKSAMIKAGRKATSRIDVMPHPIKVAVLLTVAKNHRPR
jgi:hypothetical protein